MSRLYELQRPLAHPDNANGRGPSGEKRKVPEGKFKKERQALFDVAQEVFAHKGYGELSWSFSGDNRHQTDAVYARSGEAVKVSRSTSSSYFDVAEIHVLS